MKEADSFGRREATTNVFHVWSQRERSVVGGCQRTKGQGSSIRLCMENNLLVPGTAVLYQVRVVRDRTAWTQLLQARRSRDSGHSTAFKMERASLGGPAKSCFVS